MPRCGIIEGNTIPMMNWIYNHKGQILVLLIAVLFIVMVFSIIGNFH